ncbi:TetR/AcrR family transcriptional regulator [Streptomyces bohaiensis]|uniref:Helix-turn-helix transcriptional regulator n=1 Tax=Streptomyces bohaiensis TaxID=1431344 RepID=A0ABX1CB19_9ACTN|nr:TetR/AcrR family transcriptional regulator [Streptomyces bohaiensis]NJQ15080.1 helix-turn-helix transcriptional regulator [Streptomyces bohaiensis]
MSGTEGDTTGGRRGNTRGRIQEVALRLFVARGYDNTSLREIAEELDVTKAALYYHFKTKEELVVAIYDEWTQPIDAIVAWAGEQEPTLENKREVLRRYSEAMASAGPLFRFMQENQASLGRFHLGERFKERVRVLGALLVPPTAATVDRIRGLAALHTIHAAVFAVSQYIDVGPEEKRLAALQVAQELLTAAADHGAGDGDGGGDGPTGGRAASAGAVNGTTG